MTTIVALQGDGYVVLGTDSRISSVDSDGFVSRVHTMNSNISKVCQISGMLIGVAGDVRAINLVSHALQVQAPSSSLKAKKLDEFVTNKFIPSLRSCFDANGYSPPSRETSEHVAEQGSEIILAVNNVVYQIDTDYAWSNDANGMYAIGTGAQYALGALAILFTSKQQTIAASKKQCLAALSTAARFDPHTGYPYQTFVLGNDAAPREPKTKKSSTGSRRKAS
jgi:ATP-dependent protease HslVU (ClpYQ) peptidase subunit